MEEKALAEVELGFGHLWCLCNDHLLDHEYLFLSVWALDREAFDHRCLTTESYNIFPCVCTMCSSLRDALLAVLRGLSIVATPLYSWRTAYVP